MLSFLLSMIISAFNRKQLYRNMEYISTKLPCGRMQGGFVDLVLVGFGACLGGREHSTFEYQFTASGAIK